MAVCAYVSKSQVFISGWLILASKVIINIIWKCVRNKHPSCKVHHIIVFD